MNIKDLVTYSKNNYIFRVSSKIRSKCVTWIIMQPANKTQYVQKGILNFFIILKGNIIILPTKVLTAVIFVLICQMFEIFIVDTIYVITIKNYLFPQISLSISELVLI